MKKKITGIVVGVLILGVVFSFAKDMIIRVSIEKGVEVAAGLKLNIKSLKVGLINSFVDIRKMELYNPPGYSDKIMFDMPEIYVDYDLPAIIKGRVHLEEMRIDLKEFIVIKNNKGELNLDSLKVVKEQKEPRVKGEKKETGMPEIQIDVLDLKIGKVIYKDYSKGAVPFVEEFDLNLDESYRDIKDPKKLVALIVVKALMKTSISRLTGFDLKGLQSMVSDTLAKVERITGEVTKTTREVRETVKTTAEILKKTTEGLKDAFGKLPFGKK
ncbi:MAG: hypothetical protein ABH869_04820 [Candidatus Omnitrophota bacterium]